MDPLIGQINLTFQIAILVIILASVLLKNKGKFYSHGTAMLIAAVLNAISLLFVMGPSLLSLGLFLRENPLNVVSLATMVHGVVGSIAEILAVWIVASWRLRSSTQYCVLKKKAMKITLILWIVALLGGVLLYLLLYII